MCYIDGQKNKYSVLHSLMKSGGQIDGQMSQSLVVWSYREVNCKVIGMCVEAGPVSGAKSADLM
jgi:hypothetical protein